VTSAEVSMPDKAVVKYDKNKVTVNKLIDAVKKAGYKAKVAEDKKGDKKTT
jgi:copper chaperone CopZ